MVCLSVKLEGLTSSYDLTCFRTATIGPIPWTRLSRTTVRRHGARASFLEFITSSGTVALSFSSQGCPDNQCGQEPPNHVSHVQETLTFDILRGSFPVSYSSPDYSSLWPCSQIGAQKVTYPYRYGEPRGEARPISTRHHLLRLPLRCSNTSITGIQIDPCYHCTTDSTYISVLKSMLVPDFYHHRQGRG